MVIESVTGTDLHGLDELKQRASIHAGNDGSEIAKQFDAVFLQSTLKSARMEQHFSAVTGAPLETFVQNVDEMAVGPGGNLAIQLEQMVLNPSINTVAPSVQPAVASMMTVTERKASGINQSADDFVKAIWPYVKQASAMIGLDPKVLMAQAALETGWGQYIAKGSDGTSSNNLFNIKSSAERAGQSVDVKTTEFINDTPVKMVASFKKYLSVQHSVNDYISLIKNSNRYKKALANVDDPKRYIDALQGAGYATDPSYADKILSIYHGNELQQALEKMDIYLARSRVSAS